MQTWVGRQKEMDQAARILEDAVTGGKNHLVFFVGDYGLGKTMTLLKTVDVAKEKYGPRILSFYTSFISPEKVANPGIYLVFKILRGIIQTKPSLRLKLAPLASRKLAELHPDILNVFRAAFSTKQDASLKQIALDFLCGTIKPNQTQMRLLNINRKIDSLDVSIEYLVALLFLLKQSGICAVVGAMDEVEYLFSLATKSAQPVYLALLRELYDLPSKWGEDWIKNMAGLSLFFAISEDGWRRLLELQQSEQTTGGPITPLRDRSATIFLLKFDRQTSEELIKKRLSLDRVSGKYQRDPLIPFTPDFVDFITDQAEGKPRWIIRFCDHVLDAGLERRVKLLDASFAKSVLIEKGMIGEAETTKSL
jgi:hypothetical protein